MGANPPKAQLIDQIEDERRKLDAMLAPLTASDMAAAGLTTTGWTPTDLLVHLSDWERRAADWYEAGVRGESPEVPGPGSTWRDLSRLNADVIAAARGRSLDDVRAESLATYARIVALVREMPEDDLVAPLRFAWTGGLTLGQFVAACTSEHYRWARGLVRKWLRARGASVEAGIR